MSHFAALFQPKHFHFPLFRRKRVREEFDHPSSYENQTDWFSIPNHTQSFWEQDARKVKSSPNLAAADFWNTNSSKSFSQNNLYYEPHETMVDLQEYTPSTTIRSIPISTSSESMQSYSTSASSQNSNYSSQDDSNSNSNSSSNNNNQRNSQTRFTGRMKLNQFLNLYGLRLKHCSMDGNCLFNSLSAVLYGTEKYNKLLRQTAIEWIRSNQENEIEGGVKVKDLIFFKDNQSSIEDYLHDMSKDGEWADYCCLLAVSYAMGLDINVAFMSEDDRQVETIVEIRPRKEEKEKSAYWIQYNQCQMHYNALLAAK